MKVCKSEEAITWYEFCQVQYSYQMFSVKVYTGKYPDSNSQKKYVSDPGHFYSVFKDLMGNLTNDAAFDHAKLMFAVGETKLLRNLTIYGLVQYPGTNLGVSVVTVWCLHLEIFQVAAKLMKVGQFLVGVVTWGLRFTAFTKSQLSMVSSLYL